MEKRTYLADIIGSGADGDPYRPVVADLGVSWAGQIESDPETGAPLTARALVVVATDDHDALAAHPGIEPVADVEGMDIS